MSQCKWWFESVYNRKWFCDVGQYELVLGVLLTVFVLPRTVGINPTIPLLVSLSDGSMGYFRMAKLV